MMTCREYLDLFPGKPPEEMHVHGLDILQHILKGDTDDTFYKAKNDHKKYLFELQEELAKHSDPEELNKVLADNMSKKDKWTRYDSTEGDLDVQRFINNKGNGDIGPVFDDYQKIRKPKPAMTLILDCAIPHSERSLNEMKERHREVFTMAVQAFQEGRPCRIIALWCCDYEEEHVHRKFFVTIKDFNDPIFSGIWGAFKTNRSTNSFLNVMMDYFIGSEDSGNGSPSSLNVSRHMPEQEFTLIDPKRLKY
jgi:hypothetical protein